MLGPSDMWGFGRELRAMARRHGGYLTPECLLHLVVQARRRAEAGSRVGRGVWWRIHDSSHYALRMLHHTDINGHIGEDVEFVHGTNVWIHTNAKIGNRVCIMHDVTIGANRDTEGAPVIEDDVFIGAGAKVLGDITVGKGATVAANSLVTSNVPAGATAVGVPARVVPVPPVGKR